MIIPQKIFYPEKFISQIFFPWNYFILFNFKNIFYEIIKSIDVAPYIFLNVFFLIHLAGTEKRIERYHYRSRTKYMPQIRLSVGSVITSGRSIRMKNHQKHSQNPQH